MEGKCLCGAITVHTETRQTMTACHCSMCRRWGGGPFLVVHCGDKITIGGENKLKRFQSSEWAERAFCSECGSHIFYRLKPSNEHIVSVGLFQDGTEFVFEEQIFIDKKPGSYSFSNSTATLTEAQVFAKYMPQE